MPASPVTSFAAELDDLVADPRLDPSERIRALQDVRDRIRAEQAGDADPDLESLLGRADTYIGDNELRGQAAASDQVIDAIAARENADLRDELIAQGMTPEELDGAGFISHERLDQHEADGTLDEALIQLEEFFAIKYTETLHPRDRAGKWIVKPGHMQLKGRGGTVVATAAPASDEFKQKAEDLDKGVADQIARGARAAVPSSPGTGLRDTGPVADIAAPKNPTGRSSQKQLLAYAKRAMSQSSTADTFGRVDENGKRVYHPSRQALHERIISKFLDHIPSQEHPQVVFTGGGYAAGKGGIVKRLEAKGALPKDALVLDPDKIKAELPEFKERLGKDPEANLTAYEEAWDIAQEIQKRAMAKKANVVVDGISNTSPEDMVGRAEAFRKAGYEKPRAIYVTRPTDEAIGQAAYRAENSQKPANRRFIPEPIMRAVHRDVSASFPGIVEAAKEGRGLHQIEVHDNTQGRVVRDGKFADPEHIYSFEHGKGEEIHNPQKHQAFLDKANEQVPGADSAPPRADTPTALRDVEAQGFNDWPEQGEAAKQILGGAKDTREKHARVVPSSPGTTQQRQYSLERKGEHDRIIGGKLAPVVGGLLGEDHPATKKLHAGGTLTDEEKNTVREAADTARGGGAPQALFLAGGPASGKTSALKQEPDLAPENAVDVNPDDLKEQLPEYQQMVQAGDRYAATGVHEESSDLGKRLHDEAKDLGLNMVLDGTGDSDVAQRDANGKVTKPGKFASKMDALDKAGYGVNALYVTTPTDTAVVRAVRRGEETGRYVPVPEIRKQHQKVSENFKEIAEHPAVRDLKVYDTSGPTPRLVASGGGGKVTAQDPRLYQQFLDKANEDRKPVDQAEPVENLDVDKLLRENPQKPGEPDYEWQSRVFDKLTPEQKHEALYRTREQVEPVDYIAQGATRYRAEHGLPEPQADISVQKADMQKADKVGRAFEGIESEQDRPEVRGAFDDFKRQNEDMYGFMTKPESEGGLGIKVDFVDDPEPYPSAEAQAQDLRENHHVSIASGLGGDHPLMSTPEYDRFRAVHDVFGHAGVGGGFDRHGEYQAWLAHMSMYTGKGRDAMSSEYHGVNSALWSGAPGTPGTGKAILLPEHLIRDPWDSEGNLVRK